MYATHQFRGATEEWWEFAQRRMQTNGVEITWATFKEAMLEKHVPSSYRAQKEREVLELKQGSMSGTEFKKKFEELSYYSGYI
jgi:hypothetical protein